MQCDAFLRSGSSPDSIPFTLFVGADPAKLSAAATSWARDSASRPYATLDDVDFLHRRSVALIEADMSMGKGSERSAFVDAALETFILPHATRARHVLLLHNLHELPTRTLLRLCSAIGPLCALVATTPRMQCIPHRLASRASVVRVRCEPRVNPALRALVRKCGESTESCRAFAHECSKLACPEHEPYHALLALAPYDPEVVRAAADIEHLSTQISRPVHALELFAVVVMAAKARILSAALQT
jgi:hypothetical protein